MKTKLKDLIKEESIKVGDKVYYKQFNGHFALTMTGVVKKIEGETAQIQLTTQKSYGKFKNVKVNKLNKYNTK